MWAQGVAGAPTPCRARSWQGPCLLAHPAQPGPNRLFQSRAGHGLLEALVQQKVRAQNPESFCIYRKEPAIHQAPSPAARLWGSCPLHKDEDAWVATTRSLRGHSLRVTAAKPQLYLQFLSFCFCQLCHCQAVAEFSQCPLFPFPPTYLLHLLFRLCMSDVKTHSPPCSQSSMK